MEIILSASLCGFLAFSIGAIGLRVKLTKETPFKAILYSYGLMFLGFLCLTSIVLIKQLKEFSFIFVFFLLVGLLGLGLELFFTWAIRPDMRKRFEEEIKEFIGRKF